MNRNISTKVLATREAGSAYFPDFVRYTAHAPEIRNSQDTYEIYFGSPDSTRASHTDQDIIPEYAWRSLCGLITDKAGTSLLGRYALKLFSTAQILSCWDITLGCADDTTKELFLSRDFLEYIRFGDHPHSDCLREKLAALYLYKTAALIANKAYRADIFRAIISEDRRSTLTLAQLFILEKEFIDSLQYRRTAPSDTARDTYVIEKQLYIPTNTPTDDTRTTKSETAL